VGVLLADEDAPIGTIAAVIQQDAALRRGVLHMARTRRAGARAITGVEAALQILGRDAVGSLVRSASIAGLLRPYMQPQHAPAWKKAWATAHGARELAASTGLGPPEEAFAAGLVLDLGGILLRARNEPLYAEVDRLVALGTKDLVAAEREILGATHVDLGYLLARRWQMPEATVQVIRYHHRPLDAGAGVPWALVFHLADALALGLGLAPPVEGSVRSAGVSLAKAAEHGFDPTILRRAAVEELASVDSFGGFQQVLQRDGLALG
jgi:HD-like signal output (HDOD) protein